MNFAAPELRPRRVFFVNRVYWPSEAATAQLLTDLAEHLAATGWDVHVVCAGANSPEEHQGVKVHRVSDHSKAGGLVGRMIDYAQFLWNAHRFLRTELRHGDIIVVKTDPPLLSVVLTQSAKERGARVVQWIQDIYPETLLEHAGAWLEPALLPLQHARDRAWRNADRCVTVGGDMAHFVASRRVDPTKLHLLLNWAPRELDLSADQGEIDRWRSVHGWTDRFVIGYSGNLGRVHEFTTVLETAELLRDEPRILFAFIGSGARGAAVQQEVRRRGLPNVQFLPPQPREQLPVTLAAPDVHLVTLRSGFESLVHPSKFAGVAAVGRPVLFIGPEDSAMAQTIRDSACGTAFQTGEAQAVARCVREWNSASAEVGEMSVRARKLYDAEYRYSLVASAWERLLGQLAG